MKERKAPQMSHTSDSFPPADVLGLDGDDLGSGDEVFALGTNSNHVMMSQLRIPSAFRSHMAD